ncbi:DUF1134 domain-containing protein [Stakelama saccharophila]|uniref:EipA family protein n=1 Tax=Stakelama saccharophila TaxID=3075605 RepID=A0ABZ0B821_9SPHN|nr:EipA family protein [Stakelama sp. W311]WNO53533.1 EipA family protein [Stakelama sp. W311]
MRSFGLVWLVVMMMAAMPATAQIRTVDPNDVIDGDLQQPQADPTSAGDAGGAAPSYEPAPPYGEPEDRTPTTAPATVEPEPQTAAPARNGNGAPVRGPDYVAPPEQAATQRQSASGPTAGDTTDAASTYGRDDLIGAAEGVFGKGAAGLADIIEDILKDQGQPNAYIAGREASGAFVVGLRYGSGIMHHRIEGSMPVYWTGPSVGFDVGGDAAKVFVLVYNLYDSQELYERFPAAEGRAYFVGGFSASYLRKGNVVLIPVRLGVGWRLGANIGYMKFSDHQKWFPF